MAKARKKSKAELRGGVGNEPAGKGSFAELLRHNARAISEDDILPPMPPNRATETFQTVGDELTRQMALNPKDPAKVPVLRDLASSMLQVIDESKRLSPDEAGNFDEVVSAYAQAYRNQPPEQRAVLQQLAGERGGELDAFFNPLEQKPLPFMKPKPSGAQSGLREARAAAIDRRADEDEYNAGNFDGRALPLATARPYESSTRGRKQDLILRSLIDDYGLDPEDVMDATLSDADLPQFRPGQGVYLSRDQFPTPEKLATYTGRQKAADLRYESEVDPRRIGEELMGQYHAISSRGGDPQLAPILGNLSDYSEDVLRTSPDPNVSDPLVALQMKPQIEKVQQELYHRAFGYPTASDRMETIGDMRQLDDLKQVESPLDLDALAPWWRGTTQQAVGGRVVDAPFTPEQVLDTIISQSGFLAEQPYLRAAARERLLPQIEYAMQASPGVPGENYYRANREMGARYQRNPEGMRLLEEAGAVPPPAYERTPPATQGQSAAEIIERMRRASKKLPPGTNDMGFTQPIVLPSMMRQEMPNRMLAALLT
ncbi:MAG: hypothetical protein ACKOEM_18610 [Planctomycetia bacterium]